MIHRISWLWLLLGCVFCGSLNCEILCAAEVPLSANTREGSGAAVPARYVSPVIGNGSLWLHVDWTGGQRQKEFAGVYREGMRYGTPAFQLLSHGWFQQGIEMNGEEIIDAPKWSQSLDVPNYCMKSALEFPGVRQEMTFFAMLEEDVIAVRRVLTNTTDQPVSVKPFLRYYVSPSLQKEAFPPRVLGEWKHEEEGRRAVFNFTFFGLRDFRACIVLMADHETECAIEKTQAKIADTLELAPGESRESVFYLIFTDDVSGGDPNAKARDAVAKVRREGFTKLMEANCAAWKNYLAQSDVCLPDEKIQRMYATSQYHMRCDATKWSFPVGISPKLWNGRFFGWDEMFIHQGLLTSNHLEIARRCPEFRKATLEKATFRVAHYGKKGQFGAKYVWESLEDGTEGAPPGFWNDHIFNMSNIARSAWTQYLYSDDLEYLKSTGYPVILECARYFRSHWVYEDSNGETFIGKCTDLERLGPAKDHPFMTTCGAVYAMRAAAEAAKILGVDAEEADDFRKVADKLVESLPVRDGAYIGFRGCEEPTVATLSGIFPYDIFDGDHKLQRDTAYKFIFEGRSHANMYPVGNSVCPWYAGKMSITMTVFEDKTYPVKLIHEAAETCGDFGELFEINEAAVSRNPWFTTAAGNCVQAVNQLLIFCRGEQIRLFYGVPEAWKDFSFRLPAYGGVMVDAEVKDGRLARLVLLPKADGPAREKVVVVPESFLEGVALADSALSKREVKDGKVYLTVLVNGKVTLR